MALYNDCGREFIEYAIGDCGCQRAIDRAQQKNRKFVTANSGNGVAFPCCFAQCLRDMAQERVANSMTHRIVDRLETIEIEQQNRSRLCVRAQFILQHGVPVPAV